MYVDQALLIEAILENSECSRFDRMRKAQQPGTGWTPVVREVFRRPDTLGQALCELDGEAPDVTQLGMLEAEWARVRVGDV